MRKPPRIPFFLIKTLVPSGFREYFLGDIEEQFQTIAVDYDDRYANRWFWKQAISSLLPLFSLIARKSLDLTVFRVAAVFAVIIPVIATSPLKGNGTNYYSSNSGVYYSPSEIIGLLIAAFTLGFLCRIIIHSARFLTTIIISLIIFTASLIIRGDFSELPWLIILVSIFVFSGTTLATIVSKRNSRDPEIRA